MPKLNADFVADWVAMLRSYLIDEQRWPAVEIAALPDGDLPGHYFDAQRRRIASVPRTIEIGDSFVCPPDYEAGWTMLQEKVKKGEDINGHLSMGHISLLNHDGLLAEWGVHHFHLGTTFYPKNPAYADRTGPLLYAIVGNEAFYAINVYDHYSFENIDVLESIHRNWPEMISHYRAKGVTGGAWNKEQRRALRRKNANVSVTTSDGTVYMPISSGVASVLRYRRPDLGCRGRRPDTCDRPRPTWGCVPTDRAEHAAVQWIARERHPAPDDGDLRGSRLRRPRGGGRRSLPAAVPVSS